MFHHQALLFVGANTKGNGTSLAQRAGDGGSSVNGAFLSSVHFSFLGCHGDFYLLCHSE